MGKSSSRLLLEHGGKLSGIRKERISFSFGILFLTVSLGLVGSAFAQARMQAPLQSSVQYDVQAELSPEIRKAVAEEKLYREAQASLLFSTADSAGLSDSSSLDGAVSLTDQTPITSTYLDALEDLILESSTPHQMALQLLPRLSKEVLPLELQLRVLRMLVTNSISFDSDWENSLIARVQAALRSANQPSSELVYAVLKTASTFPGDRRWQALSIQARAKSPGEAGLFDNVAGGAYGSPQGHTTIAGIGAIFREKPNLAAYRGGAFNGHPRLFMFCRHDRRYPCLFVMKDKADYPVLGGPGKLWSQPSLGYSKSGRKFEDHGGYTPSGVYQIDGVMPDADQTESFGKFRRLVLNFAPASRDEQALKQLLPKSHASQNWWREATIARDLGRESLRIHGTGRKSPDEGEPWFPFRPTSGCIAQRENKYGGVDFVDQRRLLDKLMMASGLVPNHANETRIRAILYVAEIDDRAAPVTLSDLESIGISWDQ